MRPSPRSSCAAIVRRASRRAGPEHSISSLRTTARASLAYQLVLTLAAAVASLVYRVAGVVAWIVRRWTDAVGEGVAQRCERCLNLVSVVRSVEVRGYAEIPGRRGRAPEDEGDVPEPEVELAAEVLAVGDGDDGRVGGRDAREGEVGEDVGSVSRRSGRARFVRDGADGGGVRVGVPLSRVRRRRVAKQHRVRVLIRARCWVSPGRTGSRRSC